MRIIDIENIPEWYNNTTTIGEFDSLLGRRKTTEERLLIYKAFGRLLDLLDLCSKVREEINTNAINEVKLPK